VPKESVRKGSGNVSKSAVDSYRAAGGSRRGSRFEGGVTVHRRRYHEGEAEYLKALRAWEESERGETTDVAAVLGGLAALYVADGRYSEAGRTLDRAIGIITSAKDAVATDWIKLFSIRAELHVRLDE
jgi:tetratricopeptide (TPR) repeat protein